MRLGTRLAPNITTPPASVTGDGELVRRAQEHPAEFAPLYLRYRDRVITYCRYRLGDDADAEDAASAIFIHALHGLRTFHDGGDSFRSWLFRIAHNEVVDRHRQQSRHPHTSLDEAALLADPARSPEEHAVTADGIQRLRGLLADLPSREREVLELRLADLTTAEIGAVLGIGEQSIWTAQSRALARVRAALERQPGEVRSDG
jgi:RNA polymerase sigma-70 factor (ECF subfamily)